MLSGEALDLAFALRENVGPETQGDGPDVTQLATLTRLSDAKLKDAVSELEGIGFIRVERAGPKATDSVVGVIVMAPLQVYLDDLERQDIED